ncbi:MAG: carboxypeptidase-like regulatory domain-containing protein [Ferruginibacter sp.]
MNKIVLSIIILLVSFHLYAQEKHTISGTIKEKNSGEVLIGASVYLLELPKIGAATNSYGFYSITAPAGKYTMIISFSGYQQDSVKIILNKNVLKSIALVQTSNDLQEVVIIQKREMKMLLNQ